MALSTQAQAEPDVTGFVLAGGQSRRMGFDKATLLWRGVPMLDHMRSLLQTVASPVHVIGRGVLPDRQPGLGPLGGVSTALQLSLTELNLVVAVDLPRLTPQFLAFFRERHVRSTALAVACRIDGRIPLLLGVRKSAHERLDARLGANQRSVHSFLEAIDTEFVVSADFPPGVAQSRLFRNLNSLDSEDK